MTNSPAQRPTVFALMGAFWPGHEANGPNQSLRALCEALGDEFAFRIIARDRAFGADAPALAERGVWVDRGFAQVRYCEARGGRVRGLGALLRETHHDLLLLSGFFDREFTIPALLLRRFGAIARRPVILSPRGEFSPGALAIKPWRKRAYLAFARSARLLDGVRLHAATAREQEEIAAVLGPAHRYAIAPNVRTLAPTPPTPAPRAPGAPLRLAFLSRIDRMKNLDFALVALRRVTASVAFDIYGPVSNAAYWRECEALIADMPAHVAVRYLGPLAHEAVQETLAGYDGFFLPTRGENFGHAIIDALAAGSPVIISDATPWRDLEAAGAGWSLPLDDPSAFTRAIDALAQLSPEAHARLREGARAYAEKIVREGDAAAATRRMFAAALLVDLKKRVVTARE